MAGGERQSCANTRDDRMGGSPAATDAARCRQRGPAQAGRSAYSTTPNASAGTVAGWITFGHATVTQATVQLTCANGCASAQQTVYNAASLGCAKYAFLAGPKILTGGCFVFAGIPHGQQIVAQVRWADGKRATLTSDGYFLPIANLNWIGVATYPAITGNDLVPSAPIDLHVEQAPANSEDPQGLVASWNPGGAIPQGYRLYYCARQLPCQPQDSRQGGVIDIEGHTTTWTVGLGPLHDPTVYCFAVAAYNKYGASPLSNEVCQQTRAATGGPLPPPSSTHVAFTWHHNVYLMNANGGNRRAVTADGTVSGPVSYPWYQWSPDGKYLLVVRSHVNSGDVSWDVLLFTSGGAYMRTLVAGLVQNWFTFYPTWAQDSDQIAYVAAIVPASSGQFPALITVNRVGVTAPLHLLWRARLIVWSPNASGGGCLNPSDPLMWAETYSFVGSVPSLQWSITRHVAVYSSFTLDDTYVTDLQTGRTSLLNHSDTASWSEAALSARGKLAVVVGVGLGAVDTPRVVLTGIHPGAAVVPVAPGELPLWSRDGQALYFVRRSKVATVHLPCPVYSSGSMPLPSYSSALWRASADGSHLALLLSADAYALGPLQQTSDGRFLIFSRIDNPSQHATVRIQRLDLATGRLVTIARDAGRPAVQP